MTPVSTDERAAHGAVPSAAPLGSLPAAPAASHTMTIRDTSTPTRVTRLLGVLTNTFGKGLALAALGPATHFAVSVKAASLAATLGDDLATRTGMASQLFGVVAFVFGLKAANRALRESDRLLPSDTPASIRFARTLLRRAAVGALTAGLAGSYLFAMRAIESGAYTADPSNGLALAAIGTGIVFGLGAMRLGLPRGR